MVGAAAAPLETEDEAVVAIKRAVLEAANERRFIWRGETASSFVIQAVKLIQLRPLPV